MQRCEHGSTETLCPKCIAMHLGIKKPQLRVYKLEDIKAVDETLAQCQVIEEVLRQEISDVDAILVMIRLDPKIYRTECGYLNLPKIKAALAHPEDYPMLPNA